MIPRAPAKSKAQRGRNAHADGLSKEALAALLLRVKLYRVLGTRLRTPFGEVDILAEKFGHLVVVEVKSRSSEESAGAAISPQQRQRLLRAAAYLAPRHTKKPPKSIRCDAILFSPKSMPRHIKNAFESA